jgi:hypothetical protein
MYGTRSGGRRICAVNGAQQAVAGPEVVVVGRWRQAGPVRAWLPHRPTPHHTDHYQTWRWWRPVNSGQWRPCPLLEIFASRLNGKGRGARGPCSLPPWLGAAAPRLLIHSLISSCRLYFIGPYLLFLFGCKFYVQLM